MLPLNPLQGIVNDLAEEGNEVDSSLFPLLYFHFTLSIVALLVLKVSGSQRGFQNDDDILSTVVERLNLLLRGKTNHSLSS